MLYPVYTIYVMFMYEKLYICFIKVFIYIKAI